VFNLRYWTTISISPYINAGKQKISLTDINYGTVNYEPLQPPQDQIEEKSDFLIAYLDTLMKDNVIAVISAKDSASGAFNDTIEEAFRQMGLNESLQGKYRIGYAAVIAGGEVIFERIGTDISDIITHDVTIEDVSMSLVSAGFEALNLASIQINGTEYALNNRGLNIVTFDTNTGRVIDSVSFDTHLDLRMNRKTPPVFQPTAQNAEITISNIGENIRTVFIRPYFGASTVKVIAVAIQYRDENLLHTHTAHLINGYEPSFFIPLGAMGNVESLTLTLNNEHIGIQEILFNVQLPWIFQWVRVVILTLIISIVYFWKKFKFSRIAYNPQSRWQQVLDISILSFYIGILLFTIIYAVNFGWIPNSGYPMEWAPPRGGAQDLNNHMVDALLLKQLHLDLDVHYSLLNAAQPYSPTYRSENKVVFRFDHVFFEGRYYSYFGIVPVLILYLPYHLITGNHLSTTAAAFVFTALGAIGIYFLWKELVKKYLSGIPYTLYLVGMICALICSHLMKLTTRAHIYESTIASAFMFSVWGLFFILRSVRNDSFDKAERKFLFLGGMCLALAVGCRPTSIFTSLLVPVILFPVLRKFFPSKKLVKDKQACKTIFINLIISVIPYIAIGSGLMLYNYARFGSVTEFGTTYMLTLENHAVMTDVGFLGILRMVFDGLFSYLFTSFTLRPNFPFIFANQSLSVFTGHFPRTAIIGVFTLPITWSIFSVFYMRKKQAFSLMIAMVAVALMSLVFSAIFVGAIGRYTIDFLWLFIVPSLLCMGFLYKDSLEFGDRAAKVVRRLSFAAMGISCFIMFAWGMIGRANLIWVNNPVVIRFISDLFMIF